MTRSRCIRTVTGLLFITLALLFVVSCTSKIEKSKTMLRSGRVYKIGADQPFTGFVTGIGRGEDYRKGKYFFKKRYKDGLLEGRSFFYYPDQSIESIEPYSNGLLNGVVTRYHENGQLKARIHFIDGFRGGAKGEMFWDEEGNRRPG